MDKHRMGLYYKLTAIMNSGNEPDLEAAKVVIEEIIGFPQRPFIPQIFDGVAACMIAGGDFRLAFHELRKVWHPARFDYAEYSREVVKKERA